MSEAAKKEQRAEHTPGPWEVVRRRDGIGISGCGAFLSFDSEADARLIAAAPTMHEVLRECADVICSSECSLVSGQHVPLCQRITAAIAKATGEGSR